MSRPRSRGLPLPPLILLLASLLPTEVSPYSVGAPDAACTDMTPQHGQTIQTSIPPYIITPNVTSIFGGERIQLMLEATEEHLEGFFIQGRQTEEGEEALGSFFTGVHKIFTCGKGLNNAVTHSNSNHKEKVTLEWEAPSDFEGDVIFRTTVVRSYTTYWTSLRSDKVTVQKRSVTIAPPSDDEEPPKENEDSTAPATTTTTTTTEPPEPMALELAMEKLYDGCGETKTCSGAPNKCLEKKNCKFLLSYTYSGNGQYEFELKGPGGGDKFVAVGLSENEFMGDDSVVVCGSKDGNVDVYMTWNNGRVNEKIREDKRGIRTVEAGEVDGSLYCRFLRNELTSPNNRDFDLKNDRFHVMVAAGPISQDNRLQYHGKDRIVSAGLASIGVTSNLAQKDTRLFRVIHGSLMIGAWICTASIGIIFARYYKKTWLASKCCSLDQWFHFHRLFMVSTWLLTMAAFALIVYVLEEFRISYHSIIGVVSVGLCFIQPFMAALRPHPGTKKRGVFNWLHWFVGNAAHILGIAAIFFGFRMFFGEGRNWVREVSWYVLIAFIAFNCITHLVLSIAQCVSDKRPKNSEVFPLKEMAGSRTLLQPDDVVMDAPHGCFRKFMLALYLPLNWAFGALLILLVVVEKEEIERQLTDWGSPDFWNEIGTSI